jgi:uncharacterized membrane protein/protein-disulfide isomerase
MFAIAQTFRFFVDSTPDRDSNSVASRSELSTVPRTKFLLGSLVLAIIAITVSGYLAYVGLTASKVVGCDAGLFNCDHVLNSQWSQVLGIPVSVPAVGLYAVVIASIIRLKQTGSEHSRLAWTTLSILSVTAAMVAAWFVALQVFSIGHFCPYCLVVHGCGFLLATAVLANRPRDGWSVPKTLATGFMIAGTMVAIQALGPVPDTFVIETHEPSEAPIDVDPLGGDELFESPLGINDSPTTARRKYSAISALSWFSIVSVVMVDEVTADAQQAPAPRVVPVSGGRIKLDARKWPVWGDVDAKYLIVEMFDYTCEHCQKTHQSIRQAAPLLGNELAVLALPVPLHRNCNDAATNSSPQRADACEIARLAISVWLVDPGKFTVYHDWLLEQKRSAGEARMYAETLVDRNALAAELSKGTASKYIAKNVLLYKDAGAGVVPKISFPTTTVVGEIGSANSVADLVRQQFGQ